MTRLARAMNSSDLTHQSFSCDADVLQATGLVSRRQSLGVLILQAREGCAGDDPHSVARIRELEAALEHRVKRLARRWRVSLNAQGVAEQITRELILDRCVQCQGRGFIPMKYDGSRLVAISSEDEGAKDVECALCLGSGVAKRNYHQRAKAAGFSEYTKQLSEWWEAMLSLATDEEVGARRGVKDKLYAGHNR